MKKNIYKLLVLILITITGFVQHAQSQEACTYYSATAFVPSDVSVNDKSYRQTHGRVYHSPASIRPITLFAPVSSTIENADRRRWRFTIHFIDSDSIGNRATISGVIKGVNKQTGTIILLGSMSSNGPNDPIAGPVRSMTSIFESQLDFTKFYYYVQVTISRTLGSANAVFFGYSLCHSLRID